MNFKATLLGLHKLLLFACFAAPFTVLAYPPAPGAQFYGTVRDSFGNEIIARNSWIIFKVGDAEIARAEIRGGFRPDENFRVMLPIDMGVGELYNAQATVAGVSFTIEAQIAGVTYPVYGIRPRIASIPAPGEASRLDFTIGEDTDDDGIPDLWELWQLERHGILAGDERYSLDSIGDGDYDKDGLDDYREYLAGTFAFVFVETIPIEFKRFDADRWLLFEIIEAGGFSYQVEASSDLIAWDVIDVALDGEREQLVPSWDAAETSIRTVEVQNPSDQSLFYRVRRIEP